MPSPKAGTVRKNIKITLKALKEGKLEYRADKTGIAPLLIGKSCFSSADLLEKIVSIYIYIYILRTLTFPGHFSPPTDFTVPTGNTPRLQVWLPRERRPLVSNAFRNLSSFQCATYGGRISHFLRLTHLFHKADGGSDATNSSDGKDPTTISRKLPRGLRPRGRHLAHSIAPSLQPEARDIGRRTWRCDNTSSSHHPRPLLGTESVPKIHQAHRSLETQQPPSGPNALPLNQLWVTSPAAFYQA